MGVQIGSVKEKTPYPKSVFGETLTEHSGITELMDDLGEALTIGRDRLRMMGGGNPSHIPQMQNLWRDRMAELVSGTPVEFDRVMADYDQPAGSPAFRDAIAGFLNQEYDWDLSRKHVAITNDVRSRGARWRGCLGRADDRFRVLRRARSDAGTSWRSARRSTGSSDVRRERRAGAGPSSWR